MKYLNLTRRNKKEEKIEEMKNLWKSTVKTTLRNHIEENLKDFSFLKKELGDQLIDYLNGVRMIRADQYQKRSLQLKLINYSGLREKLEEVEAFMQAKVDQHFIANKDNEPI